MQNHKKALQHLSQDPIMKRLIEQHELAEWLPQRNLFLDLLGSIIGQQLSVKAGNTIEQRFLGLFVDGTPNANDIQMISDEVLRSVGISYGKIAYIKGVCAAVNEGRIDFEELRSLPDEEIIMQLVQLKGIGQWTAEMFLIFSLGREDVFSVGDLGLRTAVSRFYKIDRKDLKAIEEVSLRWKPYRSYASRYLWKSLDNEPK